MLNSYDDAEAAVLGSMLIDDRCVPMLMQELSAEDLPSSEGRHIFEVIRAMYLERAAIDPVTVLHRLGGELYAKTLAQLMERTYTAAHSMEYAKILRDRRQLREIQAACVGIVDAGTDLAEAKRLLMQAAGMLTERQTEKDRFYGDMIVDFLHRQEDKTPPDLLDWGIEALNKRLAIGPGRFVVLGADSSVGKTALALQFALSIARKKRVGFFSYETTISDAADRLIANDADVSLGRAKHKKLTDEDFRAVVAAGLAAEKVSLRVLETARYTVEDIRVKTITRGFEVIIVDYVQLIPTRSRDRYEAVTGISIGLHAIAQELGVTVIGLSQVTVPETDKKGSRRYITKDDLRESRQLKQDADAILLLDLVDPTDRDGNRVLQIAKNRDGPLGHLLLSFDATHMRFSYVPPMEDPKDARSRERYSKMDANREARRQKEQDKLNGGLPGQTGFEIIEEVSDDDPFG